MPLGVDDLKNLLRPGAAPGGKAKLPAKRGRNKGAKVFADIRQVEYDADLFVRGALRAQPPPPRGKPLGKLVKPRVSNNPARLNGLHPDPERKPKKQAPPPPPAAARKARAKKPEAEPGLLTRRVKAAAAPAPEAEAAAGRSRFLRSSTPRGMVGFWLPFFSRPTQTQRGL